MFQSEAWFSLQRRSAVQAGLYSFRLRFPCRDSGGFGVLELVARRGGGGRVLGPLAGLVNCYTPLFGPLRPDSPLVQPEVPSIHLMMDLAELRSSDRSGVIVLSPLATEDPCTQDLISALRQQGYWVRTFHCFGNWYFQTHGKGYSEYLASRPSQLRNTLRRALGKLNKSCNWNIELHQSAGEDLESAIQDYAKVYQASWKPREADPEFVFSLIRMAAVQGSLRLGLLKIDGEARAAQLWFVKAGVVQPSGAH